jgi:HSP20 family protein
MSQFDRLVRRDPLLAELDTMTENFDRMFGIRPAAGGPRGWLPPVDIWETEGEIMIELDVPGCKPQDLSAEIVNNQLVVTGERGLTEGAQRRYRSERWQGRFVRTFQVSSNVDGSRIEAHYEDGVLTVKLPKPEEAKPRRIDIGTRSSSAAIETTAS